MGKRMVGVGLMLAGILGAAGCRAQEEAGPEARMGVRLAAETRGTAAPSRGRDGGPGSVGVEFVAEQVRLCGGRIR